MSDGVKFIFKSLIKVPIFIVVSYFIFNMVFLAFIYFKTLGMSYVVMQVAVENNYIPEEELKQLVAKVAEWNEIPMVTDTGIIIDTDGVDYKIVYDRTKGPVPSVGIIQNAEGGKSKSATGRESTSVIGGSKNYTPLDINDTIGIENNGNRKGQYGKNCRVGVHCGYTIIWPLAYHETITSRSNESGGRVIGFKDGTDTTVEDTDFATGELHADVVVNGNSSGARINERMDNKKSVIAFDLWYDVPGLKYYPDLI